jgi:hypothetical protein
LTFLDKINHSEIYVIFLQPCSVRNWELQVHFKVHGKGKDLYGDGFAIWYAKDRMVPGSVFGNMDYFQGLAVILDTYSNHNGPHNVSCCNLWHTYNFCRFSV